MGLHLEGPYLGPRRRGVHDGRGMTAMTDSDVDRLLSAGIGRLVLTVAPEQVTAALVRRLVDGGVIVSLGHSDASYEEAMTLIDSGATGITHLFNAMSPLQSRAPGLVGAALDAGSTWCGVIADGIHVAAARSGSRCAPSGRPVACSWSPMQCRRSARTSLVPLGRPADRETG